MAKLSYEDKKESIRLYNDEHYGYIAITNMFNVQHATIERTVRMPLQIPFVAIFLTKKSPSSMLDKP